jgi:hypothetical protein
MPNIYFQTFDYRGNFGVIDFSEESRGPFSILENHEQHVPVSAIEDGTSQTIYCWETVGAKFVSWNRNLDSLRFRNWDDTLIGTNAIYFSGGRGRTITRAEHSSLLPYSLSWAGNATGALFVLTVSNSNNQFVERYLESNQFGDPFSMHPAGFQVAFADGSIRLFSRKMDLSVLRTLLDMKDGQIMAAD